MDGDSQAYIAFPHHRKWFNKLWFSEKMGYRCGPCGLEVQKQGWYITRPIINLSGMSVGAKKKFLEIGDLTTPPGHFWCEYFSGIQYSVSYKNTNGSWIPDTCWRGTIGDANNMSRFSMWERVQPLESHKNLPTFFDMLSDLEHINVEFIDDKPIEVHLRRSPDPDFDILIPIWADEHFLVDKYKEMGYSIIFSYDDADGHLDVARIAFAVKNKKECNMQVMEVSDKDYFTEVKDRHGASAYVFIEPDNQHRIVYKDKSGMEFFHEEYAHCSIELVERAAIDWATGKRSLV